MTTAELQLFPVLPPAVEACLRASIERFGVLIPVTVDQHGRILDGHHRARIAADIGVPFARSVVTVAGDDEAREIARTLNADRRHLSEDQRREVAFTMVEQGHSYRAIAGALGVSKDTIQRDVDSGVSRETPADLPDRVKGIDGKSYPRRPGVRLIPEGQRLPIGGAPAALQLSESNEWYTPTAYIEAARAVMGGIDLDPASCEFANRVVKAERFLSVEDDGMGHAWAGRVWLNPPYGREAGEDSNQARWTTYLVEQFERGGTDQAVLLVNAVTDRKWFQPLWDYPICFTDHRIRFYDPAGEFGAPTHGNALVYMGAQGDRFAEHFRQFGPIVERIA